MNSWMYSANELYNMKGFSERYDPIDRSSSSPNLPSTTSVSDFSNSSDSDTEVPHGKQLENIVSKLHLKHSACDPKEAKTSDSDDQNRSTKRYNMDETLTKRFCADNQALDPARPPAELQKMVSKRLIKDIGDFVCLGCVYKTPNEPNLLAHMGLFGCLEPIEVKLDWVSLNSIYKDSLKALKIDYDQDMTEGWKQKVLDTAREVARDAADGFETRPTRAEDADLIEAVTPEIVGVIAQEVKFLHMWLCGISTFEQCPHMTFTDLDLHFDDAITNCSYWCANEVSRHELYKEVANLLTIKSKYI